MVKYTGDSHTCLRRDCKYHNKGPAKSLSGCDYFFHTGQLRRCPVKDCEKYEPVKRKRRKYSDFSFGDLEKRAEK